MVTTAVANQIYKYTGKALLNYRALPDTRRFHASQAKIRWLLGGNRSGKSEANIGADLASFALGIHPFRDTPEGRCVIWCGTETWAGVGKLLWEEKIKPYLPPSRIVGIRWHNRGDDIPKQIIVSRGGTEVTQIEFKAFEQGRKAFEGRAIDAFYGDEQCKNQSRGIWQELQARLLDKGGFVAWSMTPIQYQSWFEERILHLPASDEVFYVDLENNRKSRNGYVADKEIDALIDEWPEEVQATRIKGHLASFFGAVYKQFNRNIHVIKPIPIPYNWKRLRGIDFGFTNPFVCLWVAKDYDENFYVYKEYYRAQSFMEDHATAIKKNSVGIENRCQTYADHEAQENAELGKYGVDTNNANKSVAAGIETVQRLLKLRKNRKPKLFIFDSCVNLIREFPGYRYPEGSNTKNPADVPIGKDDHALDALRYAIHTYVVPGGSGVVTNPSILGKLY